jgi:hypothetical protein
MAVLLGNIDFENGTDGAAITTSNETSFNTVTGTWTFSSGQVLTGAGGGSLSAKLVSTGTANILGNAGKLWTSSTKIYYRYYWYCDVFTSATTSLSTWRQGASTLVSDGPRITTAGVVQIRNSSSVVIASSASGFIVSGLWYRFEGMVDATNAQAQMKVFKGSNVNGSTPDYDTGVVTSTMGSATAIDNMTIGHVNAATATSYFDNLQVNDATSSWVGSIYTPPSGGNIKVWNGSAWVAKPVKVWNGSAWVIKPAKKWNGSAWVVTPY